MCSMLYPSTRVTPVGCSPGPLTPVLNMDCRVSSWLCCRAASAASRSRSSRSLRGRHQVSGRHLSRSRTGVLGARPAPQARQRCFSVDTAPAGTWRRKGPASGTACQGMGRWPSEGRRRTCGAPLAPACLCGRTGARAPFAGSPGSAAGRERGVRGRVCSHMITSGHSWPQRAADGGGGGIAAGATLRLLRGAQPRFAVAAIVPSVAGLALQPAAGAAPALTIWRSYSFHSLA